MSRSAIRSSLAALAMAIAAGTAVAPAIAAPGTAPAAAHHRGPMMERDGLWVPGLGPLSKAQVEALKLDAKQQALFDQARDASRQAMQARRDAAAASMSCLTPSSRRASSIRAPWPPKATSAASSSKASRPSCAIGGWPCGIA